MRCLVIAAVIGAAVRAHAQPADRLVLLDPPHALEKAAHDQLGPYRIDVVIAKADGSDASSIAGHYHARAVAWLDGGALVVYDAGDGAIATRPAPTPLDDANAAGLALTLKTVLRTHWDEEDAVASAMKPPPLEVGIVAGLRLHGSTAEPRITLVADAPVGPFVLGVRGSLGDGAPVHQDAFTGTWNDRALGAVALWPWTAGEIAFRAGAGASLHFTDIHGVLLPAGDAADGDAVNFGFDAEASALWRRPPIAFGARAATTWVPWRQRYTVTDVAVFEVSHVEAEIGVVVIFAF